MQLEENKNKINVWLPLLLSVIMLGGMLVGAKLQPPVQETKIVFENTDGKIKSIGQGRVEELIRYIQAKYVDTINTDALVETAITSLFKDLDPHSVYMSASQVKKANEQLEGSFVGIGIEYLLLDDTIVVLNLIEGGPAKEVGIQRGDKIIDAVGSNSKLSELHVKENNGIISKLRGASGSKVELTVLRNGESKPLSIEVTRNRIIVSSVDVHYMLDDKTGYIKLNKFSANTLTDFMDALKELVDNHQMENLVFDLRQNGGGYLHEAIKVLNQIFAEKDQKLVYTIGKNVKKEEFFSAGRNIFDINKICVLIDENSASASEIVAGAVQDWDRGLIIGRRSYGKGLVQEQFDLKDGSALRLTVARYYTPAGRLIQRDYAEKSEYDSYLKKRIESGEFTNNNQVEISDTSKFYTANGREVYAGGGITPDIYVPYDSLLLDDYYQELSTSLTKFAFKYISENDISLSETEFINQYQLDDSILASLQSFHEAESKENTKKNEELNETIKKSLLNALKARIGKQLFGDLAFYKILHSVDPVIEEALNAQKSYSQLTQKH
jgi:carboxyl-terminal processing protease